MRNELIAVLTKIERVRARALDARVSDSIILMIMSLK